MSSSSAQDIQVLNPIQIHSVGIFIVLNTSPKRFLWLCVHVDNIWCWTFCYVFALLGELDMQAWFFSLVIANKTQNATTTVNI